MLRLGWLFRFINYHRNYCPHAQALGLANAIIFETALSQRTLFQCEVLAFQG
jgi:hypothetical protein